MPQIVWSAPANAEGELTHEVHVSSVKPLQLSSIKLPQISIAIGLIEAPVPVVSLQSVLFVT